MARIHEEIIVIKLSKLCRDAGDVAIALPEGFVEGIESVVADLIDDPSTVVEVIGPDEAE